MGPEFFHPGRQSDGAAAASHWDQHPEEILLIAELSDATKAGDSFLYYPLQSEARENDCQPD